MATIERLEDEAPSLEEFKRRVEQNPESAEAMRALAWEFYGRGHNQEALATLVTATEKFPEDAEIHYAMGLVLKRLGKRERARAAFSAALERIDAMPQSTRRDMLRRLATGQVNQLDHGSWDLPQA